MESLGTFWTILTTVWSWVWAILNIVFGLPVIGFFLQLGFYVYVGYLLYRYSPSWLVGLFKRRVVPYSSIALKPLRRLIVQWIAEPEWLSASNSSIPRIEVRKVILYRTSWGSRFRWLALGMIVLTLIQNYSLIAPYLKTVIPV